jgi:DeoR/GlpR family transcriptional regulator of sugar metabolism
MVHMETEENERNERVASKPTKRSSADRTENRGNLRTWVVRAGDKAKTWKNGLVAHVVTHDFIHYGDSLLLGSGTTPIYLMKALVDAQIAKREALDLAIVTSNLQVLYAVRDAQRENADVLGNTQVIVTGGRLNNSLDSMIGDHAALSIRSDLFNPRLIFVGAAGLSFRNGLNISFQFEEEISTQNAFATRSTTDRVLLCDHSKVGRPSFYNLKLSIEELMKHAQNCYVITTYDPASPEVTAVLEQEEKSLREQLEPLVDKPELEGKDFVFRMVRADGAVERELRLNDLRKNRPAQGGEPMALPVRVAS